MCRKPKYVNELLKLFYSLPAHRVSYNKRERDALWQSIKASNKTIDLELIKKQSPALAHQIYKSFIAKKNIQSAVFSECAYSQALADMFFLDIFANCLEEKVVFPDPVLHKLKEHNIVPRYLYKNEDDSKLLIQAGGRGGIDCLFVSVPDSLFYTIEFKEPGAKTSELDLPRYQEDGRIHDFDAFIKKNPQFSKMIAEQSDVNFFDNIGNNVHGFSAQSVQKAVSDNYLVKQADIVCTEDKNGLIVMFPAGDMPLWARTEGEIRPAGRNKYGVWTPVALERFLREKGAMIHDAAVSIDIDDLSPAKERGGTRISRYKINALFYAPAEKCLLKGNKILFSLNDVKQLKPTITAKVFFDDLEHCNLKNYYS